MKFYKNILFKVFIIYLLEKTKINILIFNYDYKYINYIFKFLFCVAKNLILLIVFILLYL